MLFTAHKKPTPVPNLTQKFSAAIAEAEGNLKKVDFIPLATWDPLIPTPGNLGACRTDPSDPHKGDGVFLSTSTGTQKPQKSACACVCLCMAKGSSQSSSPRSNPTSPIASDQALESLSLPNPSVIFAELLLFLFDSTSGKWLPLSLVPLQSIWCNHLSSLIYFSRKSSGGLVIFPLNFFSPAA